MTTVKHVLEASDDIGRQLRVEATQDAKFMMATIDGKSISLNPTVQRELWRFLNTNLAPEEES